jgi:chromosome segregation ATPase
MDIIELRNRIQALPTLENKLSALQKELQTAQNEVSELLRQYERERGDVERLEKESLSTFLRKLVGRYEDKLDREQQEEISAKLNYDRAAARLDSLSRERDSLNTRISDLRAEERQYQAELEQRRSWVKGLAGEPAERYAKLERERNAIMAQFTEIEEAKRAASRAKATALNARKSLDSAQGWATFDAFTRGGIISHMAKYSHIDEAEQSFSVLSSQLRDLKTELSDVNGMSVDGLSEISGVQRAVDFWFDNIFTDLSVRGQIMDNAAELDRLLRAIETAEAALSAKLKQYKSELDANRRAEEALLASL